MASEGSPRIFESFVFRTDLLEGAKRELGFLSAVDSCFPLHRDDNVINNALHRYAKLWLPLAARHNDKCLPAPLDIEWVWHCHMLSPVNYPHDCLQLVGVVINHTLYSTDERKDALMKSYAIWKNNYPSEPFEVIEGFEECSQAYKPEYHPLDHEHNLFRYDIKAAMTRQKGFYYHVMLPHYNDARFLTDGLKRYQKFLHLAQLYPDAFITPCYDIDLIWHTHQLYPYIYKEDMEKILGRVFDHDDDHTDRSPDTKLTKAHNQTRALWQSAFQENYGAYGAMYRGESPRGKLSTICSDDVFKYTRKQADIKLSNIRYVGLKQNQVDIKLKIRAYSQYPYKSQCFPDVLCNMKLKGDTYSEEIDINCVTEYRKRLVFTLSRSSAFMGATINRQIGNADFDLAKLIDNSPPGHTSKTSIELAITSHVVISFDVHIDVAIDQGLSLKLSHGIYENERMSDSAEQIWGPVPLNPLPPDAVKTCYVASHRLINHNDETAFTCRVIHSLPHLMSAVQVFFQGQMAAVGHLISTHQLPIKSQLEDTTLPHLQPGVGQRAILIKNNDGDWGILLGQWTGMNHGHYSHAKMYSADDAHRSTGTLEIYLYRFAGDTWDTISLYERGLFNFVYKDLEIDLMEGNVIVKESDKDVAEKLAVTFSIALLHVLCQPHHEDWKPGLQTQRQLCHWMFPRKRERTGIPSCDMAFVQAAGYSIPTPNNFYIQTVVSKGYNCACPCDSGACIGNTAIYPPPGTGG